MVQLKPNRAERPIPTIDPYIKRETHKRKWYNVVKMTNQYQQDSINLNSKPPTTFYIRNLGDLDQVAPADSQGARVISTPKDMPGIELRIEGMLELPEGEYIVDDAAIGDQQGVTFVGRSANLDGLSGDVESGLIVGTNGMNIRRMSVINANALGSCLEFGNLIEVPVGIPEFRTSAVESLILKGSGGGIRLFNAGAFPSGGITAGTLIREITMRCGTYGIRFENDFTAGVRIAGIVNISEAPGLRVVEFTQVAPAVIGPLAIRDSSFFGSTGVPGDVQYIVFADDSITAGGNFAIEGCGFEAADPADAIYNLLSGAAVVPGVGTAANLISNSNVIIGAPPVAIASNP